MSKIAFGKCLVLCVVLFALAGCGDETGWSHNCNLICLNRSTGQQEEIQRVGTNASVRRGGIADAVCKETKPTCELERSATCVNTARWTTSYETIYANCTSVGLGQCTKGCARN